MYAEAIISFSLITCYSRIRIAISRWRFLNDLKSEKTLSWLITQNDINLNDN